MASLPQWDRLVRFVSAKDGQVRYGEPIIDGSGDIDEQAMAGTLKVRVLAGSTALAAAPTGEEDQVKQLLGPLSQAEVPIIRCVGLNYKSHSSFLQTLRTVGKNKYPC